MDPLSVTANIITVIQATYDVISICQNYRAARKNSVWGLSNLIEELKCVRNVLESLETLADQVETGRYILHLPFLMMKNSVHAPINSFFLGRSSMVRRHPISQGPVKLDSYSREVKLTLVPLPKAEKVTA